MAFQRVRQRSVTVVEIPEIRAINGGTGNDTRRDRRQHMTRVGERSRIGQVHGHKFVAASGVGKNAIWATNLIGELGNAVEFSVALDLNTNKDEVVGSEAGSRATFVDTVSVSLTAIFDN
jgi:hypothetical protein